MREQVPMVLGVASRELVELATLDELLAGVGSRRLEQAILRRGTREIRRHERLTDQVREAIDDLRGWEESTRRNRTRRLQREGPGEDRQATQDHPLRVGQQLVAPFECRVQRLLTRQRRPDAGREQSEAIVEAGGDALDAERGDPRRGELDRE